MTPPTSRDKVLRELLAALQSVRPGERALVALDGFDGVGKSHVASELLALAPASSRPLVSVTIDRFHHPRAARHGAGRDATSFYRSSYRYGAFRRCVAEPLRTGHPIIPGVWDVDADEPLSPTPVEVPPDGIVLVDGIFLQRPELADLWDATVWVQAPFSVTVPRGNARFAGVHDPDPESPTNARYVGGQRLYLAEADPAAHSTWILDNTSLEAPVLTAGERTPR